MKKASVPDMYDKIDEESTALGNLTNLVPGFSGYLERSRRREADQILRETISSRLEQSRLKLSNVQQDMSGNIVQAIEFAEAIGRADTRLMGLIGKIKDAPQGYAGFFDAVKIKEDDLARIYEFDESMLGFCDQIGTEVDALELTVLEKGDIGEGIGDLDATLREALGALSSRQELLSGVV
jgi:hypothetical protein